ncbi:MAG: DUF1566 domain-containing protein [Crocinitomicaceae bacterium]|nr:DUF1566 domain-containing protein [Crocinitomicaceae bacterium]
MKTFYHAIASVIFLIPACLFAQVQMDKKIELTGVNGDRMLTNLESPVDPTDAVNKAYVDAAVAATGGSGPTMISDESSSSVANFGNAVRYCKNLNEGGYTDWKMPRIDELLEIISHGGSSVSNDSSSNIVWTASSDSYDSYYGEYKRLGFRFSDGYSAGLNSAYSSGRVRCVR